MTGAIKRIALSGVARAMAQAGNKEEGVKVANRALAAAESIHDDEWGKAHALSAVAPAMAQAGDKESLNRALALAEKIQDGRKKRVP